MLHIECSLRDITRAPRTAFFSASLSLGRVDVSDSWYRFGVEVDITPPQDGQCGLWRLQSVRCTAALCDARQTAQLVGTQSQCKWLPLVDTAALKGEAAAAAT